LDIHDRIAALVSSSILPFRTVSGTCFGAGDELAERDRIRSALGYAAWRGRFAEPPNLLAPKTTPDSADRSGVALNIWTEGLDPRYTIVATYLASRGLSLSESAALEVIRFHSSCPFGGRRVPTMRCLVRNIITNAPTAVHRTALSTDGSKIKFDGKDRLAIGALAGGAVKLTGDADVGLALGIGEGIETSLSLRLAPEFGATTAVWSLISAGGIAAFPVLTGIESLWIAVDYDTAGTKAAAACASRWRDAGREVFLVRPLTEKTDLNDLAGGRHA